MPFNGIFAEMSPLQLVSYWPDEYEKSVLVTEGEAKVKEDAERSDPILTPGNLAGGVKHTIRKRVNQAARSARAVHGGKRDKEIEQSGMARALQAQSRDQRPVTRINHFVDSPVIVSSELYARSRVGEQALVDDALMHAASELVQKTLGDRFVRVEHDPILNARTIGAFADTRNREQGADVSAKALIATFNDTDLEGHQIYLKSRNVGVLSLYADGIGSREFTALGSLAFAHEENTRSPDFDGPKQILHEVIERDAHASYEDRVIEPTLSVLYLCRSGLETTVRR